MATHELEGNSQSSSVEGKAIAEDTKQLLTSDATFVDLRGDEHPLNPGDVCVLSPYNAQVYCLKETVPEGVRVGTVDKFQGQTTQIVYFNVAESRARCLAKVVASPRLIGIKVKSVSDMRLTNALCRFVEVAGAALRIQQNPGRRFRQILLAGYRSPLSSSGATSGARWALGEVFRLLAYRP